ncbi:MAG: hypothetical protein Q9222_001907 [Ikaeria aurantiellina]
MILPQLLTTLILLANPFLGNSAAEAKEFKTIVRPNKENVLPVRDNTIHDYGQSNYQPNNEYRAHKDEILPRDDGDADIGQLEEFTQTCNWRATRPDDGHDELRVRAPPATEILWSNPAQCLIVDMYKSRFMPWGGRGNQYTLGTSSLCGCLGMAIVGPAGVVISHIAPTSNMNAQYAELADALKQLGTVTKAYTFSALAGGVVSAAGVAAAQRFQGEVGTYLTGTLGIATVIAEGYNPGPNMLSSNHLGAMIANFVNGVKSIWVNDRTYIVNT